MIWIISMKQCCISFTALHNWIAWEFLLMRKMFLSDDVGLPSIQKILSRKKYVKYNSALQIKKEEELSSSFIIAMSILTYFQARGALHMLGQWPGYVCALSRNEVILIFRFMYSKYRIVGSAGGGCVVARYEPWKATFQSVTRTTPYLECVDKIKIPDWISPILQIPSN